MEGHAEHEQRAEPTREELERRVRELEGQLQERQDLHRVVHELHVSQEEIFIQNEHLSQVRRQLQASRDRLADLYDFAPLGYLTLDRFGVVREANLTASRMLGLERERLLNRPLLSFVGKEEHATFLDHMRRCRTGEQQVVTELVLCGRGRPPLAVQLLTRIPPQGSEAEIGFRTALTDVSERKRSEQALIESRTRLEELNRDLERRGAEAAERNEQLRRLAWQLTQAENSERGRIAGLLHDHLQQLLFAARLRVGMLRNKTVDPAGRAALEQLGQLLKQSIQATRDLTAELCPSVLYRTGFTAALEWLARSMREQHGLQVDVIAEVRADTIHDDLAGLLFQSVRELLFNVVKHAGVERACVRLARSEGGRLTLEVRDEGQGFDPAQARRGGAAGGFGLFHLAERLDLLGGRVSIESAPGAGTTVVLDVPERGGAEEPREAEPERDDPPATPDGIRVLLAEDHAMVSQGLTALLRDQEGIEMVGTAADGRTAVERALAGGVDVVLMDVDMPLLTGVEATRRIRSRRADVRVIGLSSHDAEGVGEAMLAAGAERFFSKSAPLEELVAAIRAGSGPRRSSA